VNATGNGTTSNTGRCGSGIGTGSVWNGHSDIGRLTIENANVNGTSSASEGYSGSGIGPGYASQGGGEFARREPDDPDGECDRDQPRQRGLFRVWDWDRDRLLRRG
jgi:hypothetical protein